MKFAQSLIQKAKAVQESRKIPAAKPNPISSVINNVVSKLSLSTVSSSSIGQSSAAAPVSTGLNAAIEQAKATGGFIMTAAQSPVISNTSQTSQSSQMGLFSKKPGGTFFGNFLRGVASAATGGILGNGANRIEIGQTKTNAQLQAEALAAQAAAAAQNLQNPSALGAAVGGVVAGTASQAAAGAAGSAIWSKYKVWILAGGAAVVGLVIFLVTRGRRPRKRY